MKKTLDERVAILEEMLGKMADALLRQGTEQSGNGGYPTFTQEMCDIKRACDNEA